MYSAERRVARRTADAVVGDDVELGRVDVGRLAEDEGERERDDHDLDGLLEQQAEEEAGEDGDEERLALVVAEREGVEDDEECGGEGGEHGKAPCHDASAPTCVPKSDSTAVPNCVCASSSAAAVISSLGVANMSSVRRSSSHSVDDDDAELGVTSAPACSRPTLAN